jgi:hypothetical protein
MRKIFLSAFFTAVVFSSIFLTLQTAYGEPFKFSSSTQFLWGDDLLGDSQAIIAQYMKFSYNPEGKNFDMAGYGRFSKDFGDGGVRSTDLEGRLYYLYLDYLPWENVSVRLGRQFTKFTADTAIMDGASLNVHSIAKYVGVTVAGGWDVRYTLDSEFSRGKDTFMGIDVHLENVRSTQLGFSYVRRYQGGDLAREELGMNFRYFFKRVSPYAEVRYDLRSLAFDEATLGVDVFPMQNLMVKAEYYHAYPTFDATSIYSVFAVDRYREYLIRAEYSVSEPLSVFVSYMRQEYQEGDDANVFSVGAKVYPLKNLTINGSFNYRKGYSGYNGFTGETDGKLYGFELYGDYKLLKELVVFAGIQYDTYNRPELDSGNNNYATRFWGGGRWLIDKNWALAARIEEDINETFDHRTLGRVSLDWTL